MLLLIDHYDSFAHNLARYFHRLGQDMLVIRSDAISPARVRDISPSAVVFSPGPCTPRESASSVELVQQLHREVPMLGICLGHQIIAVALGGQTVRAAEPVHGRSTRIDHSGRGLFLGLPNPLMVGRYHSLVVDESSLPPELQVTARAPDDAVMAIEHRELPVVGLQFHPESILTDAGYDLLAGFLRLAGLTVPATIPASDEQRFTSNPAAHAC